MKSPWKKYEVAVSTNGIGTALVEIKARSREEAGTKAKTADPSLLHWDEFEPHSKVYEVVGIQEL